MIASTARGSNLSGRSRFGTTPRPGTLRAWKTTVMNPEG